MLKQASLTELEQHIHRMQHRRFLPDLRFTASLEQLFDRDTAVQRSHRLWQDGLFAIIALNACLLLDLLLIHDPAWKVTVLRTSLITPGALLVNLLMRSNPPQVVREGSVAFAAVLICSTCLYAQGSQTVINTVFGLMCIFVTVLFAGVVMRLRLPYAALATLLMLGDGIAFLARASVLQFPEKLIAGSLLAIGVIITITANYSLERQERLSYLLLRRGTLQTEELADANAMLRELSSLDKLTGLPNRRTFDERFSELWAKGERDHTVLSVILLDIDRFKALNDRFGHLFGDQVLHRVALLIPRALRGEADCAARFGGEEFVVLLPGAPSATALTIAERIRSLVEAAGTPVSHRREGEPGVWVTVSCGVSTCIPGPHLRREDLLEAADKALYRAKEHGRNRVRLEAAPPREMVAATSVGIVDGTPVLDLC